MRGAGGTLFSNRGQLMLQRFPAIQGLMAPLCAFRAASTDAASGVKLRAVGAPARPAFVATTKRLAQRLRVAGEARDWPQERPFEPGFALPSVPGRASAKFQQFEGLVAEIGGGGLGIVSGARRGGRSGAHQRTRHRAPAGALLSGAVATRDGPRVGRAFCEPHCPPDTSQRSLKDSRNRSSQEIQERDTGAAAAERLRVMLRLVLAGDELDLAR